VVGYTWKMSVIDNARILKTALKVTPEVTERYKQASVLAVA